MKNYIYSLGAFALALSMSGLPALARAESDVEGQVRVQALGASAGAQVTTRIDDEESEKRKENIREVQKQNAEAIREQGKNRLENASSSTSSTRPSIKGGDDTDDFELELDDDNDDATSNDDLNKRIEVRKHQLEQEVASSSPEHQAIVANANEVRLAVHALLASKGLIGGIGEQVSAIAKEVDHSVASTTRAEAKIQSRGFFSRIFFGGDTASAEVIAQEAAKNQARIDSLTTLLIDATISADVQATLKAQVTALQTAQARLQTLAEKEKTAWGIFSWRF